MEFELLNTCPSCLFNSILVELLDGNSPNAAVFRDSDGLATLISFCKFDDAKVRSGALSLFEQLIIGGGNENDMTALLELIHRFRSGHCNSILLC